MEHGCFGGGSKHVGDRRLTRAKAHLADNCKQDSMHAEMISTVHDQVDERGRRKTNEC